MDSRTENAEPSDPDYENLRVDKLGEVNESLHREDARDETVQKIQRIIHEQFSFEIELKEKEVTSINRRVHETRSLLDRLRACILAGYYGYGGVLRQEDVRKRKTRSGKPRSKEACLSDVMKWKQSLPSNLKEHPVEAEALSNRPEGDLAMLGVNGGHPEAPEGTSLDNYGPNGHLSSAFPPKAPSNPSAPETILTLTSATETESRFYVKRRVIVGNTSKFIPPEHRESNDRSTHKWMVYVRGPKDNSELQNFVSKVWFLLHPSYQPNDLVEVSRPPFQVTRRGWGEFPVRVQLHFVENKNKRVDIIHHLKLDKTYTGLQTLGAETHVDIELDRKNFDCQSSQNENYLQPAVDSIGQTSKMSVPQTSTATPINCKPSNFDLLQELNHHETDHSYSVPLTKQQKPPSDDGMKYPTPPVSVPGSRCSTPEPLKESLFSTLANQSEVSLRKSVQQFPLVDPDHNVAISPYCAKTLDQYLGWNIGKRLAAEWQRSLAIRDHLRSNNPSAGLTTKEVMNYCRIHGYTPMASISADEKTLCKICGEEKSLEMKDEDKDVEMPQGSSDHEHCDGESETPGTLSNAEDFLNLMETTMSLFTEAEPETDCEMELADIDVVGITDRQSKGNTQNPKLLFLPITEELEWVQETAAEVDIHLQSVNLDGVRSPVTAAMLYKACGLLVHDILRKANRFTWRTPSTIPKTNCILPTHIRKAVEVVPHCDFLTNKYLGVVAPSVKD